MDCRSSPSSLFLSTSSYRIALQYELYIPSPKYVCRLATFHPHSTHSHCPVSAKSKKCARCIDHTESAAKTPTPPIYKQLFFPISTLPFRSQSPYPDPRQTTHPTPPKSCRARLSLRFVLFLESSLLSAVATSQSWLNLYEISKQSAQTTFRFSLFTCYARFNEANPTPYKTNRSK